MSLFQWGDFTLHSGGKSWWRIDCDSLTDSEIELFAKLISEKAGEFDLVYSPTSHLGSCVHRLKTSLYENYATRVVIDHCLIIDDVLSTGNSMEDARKAMQNSAYVLHKEMTYTGVVLFARGKCPDWITPIFQLVP